MPEFKRRIAEALAVLSRFLCWQSPIMMISERKRCVEAYARAYAVGQQYGRGGLR